MEVKEVKCYICLKCNEIYTKKSYAYNCECEKKCSSSTNGFHSWFYLYCFGGMAFYKCKDCGTELTGVTSKTKRQDPLDEIFINKLKAQKDKEES